MAYMSLGCNQYVIAIRLEDRKLDAANVYAVLSSEEPTDSRHTRRNRLCCDKQTDSRLGFWTHLNIKSLKELCIKLGLGLV